MLTTCRYCGRDEGACPGPIDAPDVPAHDFTPDGLRSGDPCPSCDGGADLGCLDCLDCNGSGKLL